MANEKKLVKIKIITLFSYGHKIVLDKIAVVFVDEVDDDLDHGVLFFGATFSNHEGEGNKGIVSDAFGSADLAEVNDLFVKSCGLVVYGVDNFEFEGFGIIFVCHVAGDDA